jgi:hypothetical protein
MATRRKYKPRAAPAVADEPQAAAPEAPAAPPPPPGADDASPLTAALRALQHAESLQHQHAARAHVGLPEPAISSAEQQAIDAEIDSAPGLTPWKRRFLKSHRSLTREPYLQLLGHAVAIARHAGIAEDTPAFDNAVLHIIARDIKTHHHLRQLTSADARQTPENAELHADIARHVSDLDAEAEQHFAEHVPEPAAAPPPSRRSYPMSAPVSRDVPSASGHRHDLNTLTAEERQVARNFTADRSLTNEQKEYIYLQQKRKLAKMRANGSYSSDDRG